MMNRRSRQASDPGHQTDPAVSQILCFQGDKTTSALFIQNRNLAISLAGARPSAARIMLQRYRAPLTIVNPIATISSDLW